MTSYKRGAIGRPLSALLPSDVLSSRFLDSEAAAESEMYLLGATAWSSVSWPP